MQYNSTRDHKLTASPAEAVLRGIAPDGGLYLCDPAALPLDPAEMLQKDFAGMAEAVLGRLLPDYPAGLLRPMITAAYGKFNTPEVTPLVQAGGYGVQGKAASFVKSIDGDFFNVVGLPLYSLVNAAREEFGIELTF